MSIGMNSTTNSGNATTTSKHQITIKNRNISDRNQGFKQGPIKAVERIVTNQSNFTGSFKGTSNQAHTPFSLGTTGKMPQRPGSSKPIQKGNLLTTNVPT